MGDALHMMRLLTRHCIGQKITAYATFDSGPKKPDEMDGPEELIIIIVDNGRSKIYADPKTRQALRCIRCGACLVSCPVYSKIGGYPYGWVYSGPIGQVLTPLLIGLDRTQDLYRACTLCGNCKKVCPAGIDHPSMLLQFRAREKHPFGEARFFDLWALGVTSAWRWRLGTKRLRAMINKYSEDGVISKTNKRFEGWFGCRDLPIVPDKSFRELIRLVEQDEERGSQ
jgi:L-lactate dehydrogenase complex protein LldF